MRELLSNLAAAMLVIHAMIGCCHHHWHDVSKCAAASTECCTRCPCSDHYAGSNDADEPASQPCSGELECQGVCTYLPTQKTVIDATSFNAAFNFAAIVPTLLDGQLATAGCWDRVHTLNHSPPPLRLHLLHQILLI